MLCRLDLLRRPGVNNSGVRNSSSQIPCPVSSSVQCVADELEHRRFAGTAGTDKAIQTVGQFELGSIEESPDDQDAPDPVRIETVIHGYPCNRYKQKSRRLLAFLRGAVTRLVTPRKKMEKLCGYAIHAKHRYSSSTEARISSPLRLPNARQTTRSMEFEIIET